MQPFQYAWRGLRTQPWQYNYAHTSNHSLQNIGGTDSTMKPAPPQPPHAWGTFHRRLQPPCAEKHTYSGFLPKTNPMQCMQHSCSHCNAFCSIMWQTRIFFCTWQQNVTPIMQPFHCDLQLPKHPLTTHTRTTTRCRTQRRNRFGDEMSAAAPAAHTRYLASLAAATLHRKTQGFVLRLPPQKKAHARFMQPLQYVLQHHLRIHAAITMRFAASRG